MKLRVFILIFFIAIILLNSCIYRKEIINNQKENIGDKIQNDIKKIIQNNNIFNTNIKTVLCYNKNQINSIPIINLKSNEQLIIKFDELESIKKNYYYTISLCNEDWTKNNLNKNEYINGFINNQINNYEFSFNTKQEYIHYQFKFPSKNISPKLSGNYIFEIYDENGKLAITRRFMVLEKKVFVNANVRRATLAKHKNKKHEIDISIKYKNISINDPFSDVKIHIKQNNHDINSITDLKPLFIKNNELIYDYEDENLFWANNEFRYFDIRSFRFLSERIMNLTFLENKYVINLFDDFKKTFDNYSLIADNNGDFFIEVKEGWDSSIESDYAIVNFSLKINQINYGNLYLIGAFSDWKLNNQFKLVYNEKKQKYEKSLFLKQGFYNYQYALHDSVNNKVDIGYIEGSHYQTNNEYYIYVYLKDHINNYDKLIGFLKEDSNNLF